MMNEHRTIVELTDAELDYVVGGQGVLVNSGAFIVENANAPNTPANGNGFQGSGLNFNPQGDLVGQGWLAAARIALPQP